MAYNNQEIEVKFPLTKKKFKDIEKKVMKMAKFINEARHIDDYYTPSLNSFLKAKYPYEWLTIRRRDNKVLLNYKHWYPENAKYTTHCDEYESEVISYENLSNILTSLDFKKILCVDKIRKTFIYKGKLEISLDMVENLGYFIEIESIKNMGGVNNARKEILNFAKKLGINRVRTVPGGYGLSLLKKNKLL